ncbi:disease resistance protein TAO1-like [Neltuma alba]|uniref:disease resistance protein TAO1-like n=1 Tax=Neltuma alba TaxID=207710 RepID=UPI0010A5013D|nr:disease resistance protein TAO1-like [Prosopis alba]
MAKVVFAKLRSKFDRCYFLKNFIEKYEKHGSEHVRDELFQELSKDKSLEWLSCRKVLIVLDDVSNTKQLDELTSEAPRLGTGSKVIITSRDKHVLNGRVEKIHEAEALSYNNSLELFNLKAFHKVGYESEYEELVERALAYAKGIPLALTVLGSFLHSRPINQWVSVLNKLERMANKDIQDVLKLSYDGLDHEVKEIFLDIAFFFKGEWENYVAATLEGFGFHARIGLGILVDKALISYSHGAVWMHDLIQWMAFEIVRQENEKNPGGRSRLRNPDEIRDVLENNRGSGAIQGISLDLSQIKYLKLSADVFRKMTNLRYLRWDNFPLESFPLSFCAEKLVELHMPHSYLRKLWDGKQELVNLRNINLERSKKLIELPDLSTAERLERVTLFACESLCHLHPSILSLPRLEFVDLGMCKNLKSLGTESQSKLLSKLNPFSKCLPLSFCAEKLVVLLMPGSQLEKPRDGMQNFVNLREINLAGCNQLIELPDLSTAQNLEQVDLTYCESLQHLHPLILSLPRLRDLKLYDCRNLKSLKCESPSKSLLHLYVYGCSSLKEFSFSSDKMENLSLVGTCVEILDFSTGPMEKLEALYVNGSALKNLPINDICYMRSLQALHLYDCGIIDKSKLHALFDALLSLETIDLRGTRKLTELPDNIKHLSRLRHLNVSGCKDLQSFPELPPSIEHLDAGKCTSLKTLQFTSHIKSPLSTDEITAGSPFCSSISYLKNLVSLSLNDCEQLYELPAGIKHLSNLQYIDLSNCRRLRSLPVLPPFFEHILAQGCTSLETHVMESAYFLLRRLVYAYKGGYISYSGRKAPEWFRFNQVVEASKDVTIELPFPTSDVIGFIFCSVVFQRSSSALSCIMDPSGGWPWKSTAAIGEVTNFDSHQVFLWGEPCPFKGFHKKMDDQNTNYRPKVLLKFDNDAGSVIEECGVLPIYASEYRNFIHQMELQPNLDSQKETCHDADENSFHGILKYTRFSLNQGKCGNFEGSIIPEWFTYKSSTINYESPDARISVRFALDFDNLIGFIFCFVIPQFSSKKRDECHSSCDFYLHDVSEGRGLKLDNLLNGPIGWHYSVEKWNSDDVFLWYDPLHSERVLRKLRRKARGHDEELEFKFHIGDYFGDDYFSNNCNSERHNCWIKECGVRPIYVSEYTNFLLQQKKFKEGIEKKRPRNIDDDQYQLPSTKKLKESSIIQSIPPES